MVRPQLAIGQAAVVDLVEAAAAGLGSNATQNFLGGEADEVPDNYAAAQAELPNTAARIVLIHGELDDTVPMSQSVGAQDLGAEVIIIPAADHFDVIDPTHAAWAAAVGALESH